MGADILNIADILCKIKSAAFWWALGDNRSLGKSMYTYKLARFSHCLLNEQYAIVVLTCLNNASSSNLI